MICYSLESDKVVKGFPASLYPVDNAPVRKGRVIEAAASLIIPKEIDVKMFHNELKRHNTDCYQFGEVWLRKPPKPGKDRQPDEQEEKSFLLSIDWHDHWPDRNLGDESTLLTWSGQRALYVCRAGATYVRNKADGAIFVNEDGSPKKTDGSQYDKLRDELSRRRTIETVRKDNVLLDYVVA